MYEAREYLWALFVSATKSRDRSPEILYLSYAEILGKTYIEIQASTLSTRRHLRPKKADIVGEIICFLTMLRANMF